MAYHFGSHDFYGKPNNTDISLANSFFEAINFGIDGNEPVSGIRYTSAQTRSWNRSITSIAPAVDGASIAGSLEYPFNGPIPGTGPFTVASSHFWTIPEGDGSTITQTFWEAYFGPEGGARDGDTDLRLRMRLFNNGGQFTIFPAVGSAIDLSFDFERGWWTNLTVEYAVDGALTVHIERDDGLVLLDHTGTHNLGGSFSHFSWPMMATGSTLGSSIFRMFLDDISYVIGEVVNRPYPRSTNFDGNTPGARLTMNNSIFDGIDETKQAEWDETSSEVEFTNERSRSGSVSISSVPDASSVTRLELPYNDTAITATDETFTFWHSHTTGSQYEASNKYLYSAYGGTVGQNPRYDGWVSTIDIEWVGANDYTVWFGPPGDWDDFTFTAPDRWTKFEVTYTYATKTWRVRAFDHDKVEIFSQSKAMPALGFPAVGDPGFAYHELLVVRSASAERNWFDNINVDPAPGDDGRERPESGEIPDWPVQTSFEDGTPGEAVTTSNSVVGGFHWDDTGEGEPWEAVFTDSEAHSGSVSITAADSYELLHFPFGADPIVAVDESFFFWCKYTAGFNGYYWDSAAPHQLYCGALGDIRNYDYNYYPGRCFVEGVDETTNRWWVEFEDANWTADGGASQYNFEAPADIWMRIGVEITTEGGFSYTLTEEGGTMHGPFSSVLPDFLMNLSPPQFFAFHLLTVADDIGTGFGRLVIDDVNTDGEEPPEPPDLRPHFYRPVRDASGKIITNVVVNLYEGGTSTPVRDEKVFSSGSGTSVLGSGWHAPGGEVDFYLSEHMDVDIHVKPLDPALSPFVWQHHWVVDPENP
jgi:hypothetical protein